MDPALQATVAAMASFLTVTLVFALIIVVCKAGKPRGHQSGARTRTAPNPDFSMSIAIGESASFDPSLNRISMAELLNATRNFAPDLVIGDGGFGLVYKAQLLSGVTVAVKKLDPDAFQGFREFRAEMETLGKLRHPNIVKMLGYYAMGSERVLVYEFIEKGSLDQWLHETSSSESLTPLSWQNRLKIVSGVANGLLYLHSLETPIIHRDIKASNVLLDSDFQAHIADFGLARQIEWPHSHVSTQVAGTMGYMPPEYIHGAAAATAMGDVYSFGTLMLEIGTGRRPNLPFRVEREEKEIRLVEWCRKMVEQGGHMEMVDDNICRDGVRENEVVEFFRIGGLCTSETSRDRPDMRQVVEWMSRLCQQ